MSFLLGKTGPRRSLLARTQNRRAPTQALLSKPRRELNLLVSLLASPHAVGNAGEGVIDPVGRRRRRRSSSKESQSPGKKEEGIPSSGSNWRPKLRLEPAKESKEPITPPSTPKVDLKGKEAPKSPLAPPRGGYLGLSHPPPQEDKTPVAPAEGYWSQARHQKGKGQTKGQQYYPYYPQFAYQWGYPWTPYWGQAVKKGKKNKGKKRPGTRKTLVSSLLASTQPRRRVRVRELILTHLVRWWPLTVIAGAEVVSSGERVGSWADATEGAEETGR